MNTPFALAAVTLGLICSIPAPLAAETTEFSGTVCWTGDIHYFGTTENDMGYTWSIDWVLVGDGEDVALNSTGTCHGSGVVTNGMTAHFPHFCRHVLDDGATYMSQADGDQSYATGVVFGGTGRMEGVTGRWEAGEATNSPAADGELVGCRSNFTLLTLPN